MNHHLTPTLVWPPPYKIKKHRQAKKVKLRASKNDGLEVTVPYRFNLNQIPGILEENRVWITKKLLELKLKQSSDLPHQVIFNAINEIWTIEYMQTNVKLQIIARPQNEIVLIGNVADVNSCKKKLITWVKNLAKPRLSAQLQALSKKTNLDYVNVTIRDQKTLWGSCTSKKSISLNYKLIFLPPNLVTHIMLHELCHTQHLNHSNQFWNLVAKYDVTWQIHKHEMRQAGQYIPDWYE